MPIDNTIFRDHVRLRDRQRAERRANFALLNPSPPPMSFDGPSDITTSRRHHFRRGAISEASRQPGVPAGNRAQATSQPEIRITSHGINEIEIVIEPSSGRQPLNNNPEYRRQVSEWRELADQIRRGLVNQNTPGIQARINAGIASLQNLTSSSRRRQTMEDGARPRPRDTYRYGREGWGTVDHESAASQRAATIPGSNFVVPDSTLNLYQSVDLFAPPPPRPSAIAQALSVTSHVDGYRRYVEHMFNETVASRLRGGQVPKGKIFTLSMELSRVEQLMSILEAEFYQLDQAEREATRRAASSRNGTGNSEERSREEALSNEQSAYMAADDDSTDSEIGEPEGWSTLDFGFDGEYPEEICFHIGSHEVTYPIEEIEDWLMDERRRQRSEQITQILRLERRLPSQGGRRNGPRILHTLAIPQMIRSRGWLDNAYSDYDDETDFEYCEFYQDDDSDNLGYEGEDDREDGENGEEYDGEDDEQDHGNRTMVSDNFDGEGLATPAPQASEAAEQSQASASNDAQSNAQPTVIDLTHSSSPETSPTRSRNTSGESHPATESSWEHENEQVPEAPHPVDGWSFGHQVFMFSCRGNIFDVTRQLQHAFGFEPELSPHLVGERLNGQWAAHHRRFLQALLPGEEDTFTRASRREVLHQQNLADDDIYHGTQDIVEGDVRREASAQLLLPPGGPFSWDRRMDVLLLQDLNRGCFDFPNFLRRHCRTAVDGPLSGGLHRFLTIRLAQVRYIGITEAEISATVEAGRE